MDFQTQPTTEPETQAPAVYRERVTVPRYHWMVILTAVARAFHVSRDDITGNRKFRQYVMARQAAMVLLREERPDFSLPRIGKLLGNRDHTTVLHGLRVMERKAHNEWLAVRMDVARGNMAQAQREWDRRGELMDATPLDLGKCKNPPAVKIEPAKAIPKRPPALPPIPQFKPLPVEGHETVRGYEDATRRMMAHGSAAFARMLGTSRHQDFVPRKKPTTSTKREVTE